MNAITRRAALLSGGAVAVLAAVLRPPPASAALGNPQRWLDASLPMAQLGTPDAILGPELVTQWRGTLLAQVRLRGEPVMALVRWDKALLLAGLAREEGWKSSIQRLGHGVFRVDVSV
ncbi:MAG: hypothetical protein IPG49_08065 [Proteobacteria bacterium]|nr:hypothetical protein [Pseudomonadota bacterium]